MIGTWTVDSRTMIASWRSGADLPAHSCFGTFAELAAWCEGLGWSIPHIDPDDAVSAARRASEETGEERR